MQQIKNLQLSISKSYVFLELESADLVEQLVVENNKKFFIASEKGDVAIPLYIADGAIDVKVHDLPPYMPNSIIAKHMESYGEILSVKNDTWHDFFPGIPNGVRIVRIRLNKGIPSYINIDNETAYVRYRNQVPTCKYCSRNLHIGSKCSDIRKALANSVNERLTLASIVQGVNPGSSSLQPTPLPPPLVKPTNLPPSTTSKSSGENNAKTVVVNTINNACNAGEGSSATGSLIKKAIAASRSKRGSKPSSRTVSPSTLVLLDDINMENCVEANNETSTPPQENGSLVNKHIRTDISPDNTTASQATITTDSISDETMDDLQEGWQEIAKKRPGSPKLAEKNQLDFKRRSRSTRRSK